MEPGKIEDPTRTFGQPSGWDEDQYGEVQPLHIRDIDHEGKNVMYSAWFPTEDEIARIVAGAPVVLGVIGDTHPVVNLNVGALD